uniref:Secreted protein n=1 Tax=Cacopsylla melanoneura TaxID=428564 RepID=A0A8D8RAY5_9HEMI
MQVKVLSYIFLITLILALVNSAASCLNCLKPKTTDEAGNRAQTSSDGKTSHQKNMEKAGKALGNLLLGTGEPLADSDTMIGALVRTDDSYHERQDRKKKEQEKQARVAAASSSRLRPRGA